MLFNSGVWCIWQSGAHSFSSYSYHILIRWCWGRQHITKTDTESTGQPLGPTTDPCWAPGRGTLLNVWTYCSPKLVCDSNCPVSPSLRATLVSTRPGTSLHTSDQAVKVGWAGEGSGCERVVLALNRETRVWQTKIRLTLGCLKPQWAWQAGWDRDLRFMRESPPKAWRHQPKIYILICRQTTSKQIRWFFNVVLLLN